MPDALSTDGVRLFVALSLPEVVKTALARAQGDMRRSVTHAKITWSRPEQLHLTLKFLGNVSVSCVTPLTAALQAVCLRGEPMRFQARSIGFFPHARRPRVIWAGLEGDLNPLSHLHQLVEQATAEFTAEPSENRFSAHITLGRVKFVPKPEVELLGQVAARLTEQLFGEWTARSLELMRSELLPTGPRHTRLAELPLGTALIC